MDHHHLAAVLAIGAGLFASMVGGAIAIYVAIASDWKAKANKPA